MGNFCPFTPLAAQRMKISKNEKNNWGYHHFTQLYQKLWLQAFLFLRYGTWWMQLLFFILGYFSTFFPSNSPKKLKWKKKKKHLDISFYTSVPKIMIICYTVLKIWHVTHVIFIFHFGLFFVLLPPLRQFLITCIFLWNF